MKKKHIIIISCVLAAGIIVSGLTFADSHGAGHRRGFGFKHHHKGGGLFLLAKYQQKNLRVQVLSEMTEQSVEAVQLKLKDHRLGSLMQELNIDRQAFRAAMQAKVRERIEQAATDGSITPEQAREILAKMETYSKRHALMSKLIEKGIEEGTITRDEARMLMRKQR
jgi:hypothetical protein